MTITSPKTEYKILHRLTKSPTQTAFLARSDETVLLVRLTDKETIDGAGVYFESLAGNGIVIETFIKSRDLWIAIRGAGTFTGVKISRVVSGMDSSERNALAKKLVDAICSRNIPWPLLYDVLVPERIAVGTDGEIDFVCLPEVFPGYERDCRASCMSRLAELMRLIYGDGGKPHVDEFAAGLDEMRFSTAEKLREGFRHLYSSINNTPLPQRERQGPFKRTRISREFIAEYAVRLVAAGLLLAGYIVLGRTVYEAIVNVPVTGDISAIGTVELYENLEP